MAPLRSPLVISPPRENVSSEWRCHCSTSASTSTSIRLRSAGERAGALKKMGLDVNDAMTIVRTTTSQAIYSKAENTK
jgi:hypothetical protein